MKIPGTGLQPCRAYGLVLPSSWPLPRWRPQQAAAAALVPQPIGPCPGWSRPPLIRTKPTLNPAPHIPRQGEQRVGLRDSLGGDLVLSVMAAINFPAPVPAMRAAGMHGQVFLNGGNAMLLAGSGKSLRDYWQEFSTTFRWSVVSGGRAVEGGAAAWYCVAGCAVRCSGAHAVHALQVQGCRAAVLLLEAGEG